MLSNPEDKASFSPSTIKTTRKMTDLRLAARHWNHHGVTPWWFLSSQIRKTAQKWPCLSSPARANQKCQKAISYHQDRPLISKGFFLFCLSSASGKQVRNVLKPCCATYIIHEAKLNGMISLRSCTVQIRSLRRVAVTTIAEHLVEKGMVSEAHKVLQELLEERVGSVPSALAEKFLQIQDLDALQKLRLQRRDCSSLDAFEDLIERSLQ